MANKKSNSPLDINLDAYIGSFLKWFFIVLLSIGIAYLYFVVYNPKEKKATKNAIKAFRLIQDESLKLYKKQGYLFELETTGTDPYCATLATALGERNMNCTFGVIGDGSGNFKIKKTNIEILGLEKPAVQIDGNIVKDFIVDVDGALKGENLTGVDRFPLRVYSTGALAGRLSPVNCKLDDARDFEFDFSNACAQVAEEIDFLTTNKPFGFSVVQIGGEDGKSKEIIHDVPFLRADCAATGGDLIAMDYCDEKQLYWLSACYDDFPCSIVLADK